MYCHKSGAGNQTAKAYCKSCGEWLPDLNARTRNTFGGETPQQIVSTNLFMSAISTLAALYSGLALYITYLPRRRRQVVCVYRRRFLSLHRWLASVELLCNAALETETQEQSSGYRQAGGVCRFERLSRSTTKNS